jgi:hypothetical protein
VRMMTGRTIVISRLSMPGNPGSDDADMVYGHALETTMCSVECNDP